VHFLSRLETHLYCSVCYVVCNMRALGMGKRDGFARIIFAFHKPHHGLVGLGYSGHLKMYDKDRGIFMKYIYLACENSNDVNYYL
jgi:hypothetical protein